MSHSLRDYFTCNQLCSLPSKNLSIFKGDMPLFAYISISKLNQAHYDRPTKKSWQKKKYIENMVRYKKKRIHVHMELLTDTKKGHP